MLRSTTMVMVQLAQTIHLTMAKIVGSEIFTLLEVAVVVETITSTVMELIMVEDYLAVLAVVAVEPITLIFGITEEKVDTVCQVKDTKVVLDGETTRQVSLVMVGLAVAVAVPTVMVVMVVTNLMAVVKVEMVEV